MPRCKRRAEFEVVYVDDGSTDATPLRLAEAQRLFPLLREGGDELNLIQRGRNYGWPRISYGCKYGTPVGGATSTPGLDQPKTKWLLLSITPSGLTAHHSATFPEWQSKLSLGALAGTALWLLAIDDRRVVSRAKMHGQLGKRMRDVRQALNGALLRLTEREVGARQSESSAGRGQSRPSALGCVLSRLPAAMARSCRSSSDQQAVRPFIVEWTTVATFRRDQVAPPALTSGTPGAFHPPKRTGESNGFPRYREGLH